VADTDRTKDWLDSIEIIAKLFLLVLFVSILARYAIFDRFFMDNRSSEYGTEYRAELEKAREDIQAAFYAGLFCSGRAQAEWLLHQLRRRHPGKSMDWYNERAIAEVSCTSVV
jgi:hypothetical protein